VIKPALRLVSMTAVLLLAACSSKETEAVDVATVDSALDGLDDAFADSFADDQPIDSSTGSCLTSGDPCVTNMDCCSASCIGIGESDSASFQTCR
jgi:hypothetical protein